MSRTGVSAVGNGLLTVAQCAVATSACVWGMLCNHACTFLAQLRPHLAFGLEGTVGAGALLGDSVLVLLLSHGVMGGGMLMLVLWLMCLGPLSPTPAAPGTWADCSCVMLIAVCRRHVFVIVLWVLLL